MAGVHVADTDAGAALVGPEGMTLYVFTADTGGESTCYDACAQLWPPVPGDTGVGSDLDATLFGTTTRTDGSTQLTVNGMPLYWYGPDGAPGDAKGQGFNGLWFVVDARGEILEASAGAATDDAADYDYGYGP
jgi:predicted lipoprotein with Yx(FWY)xxD motif